MYREVFLNFLNIFANIYFVLIFARIILSFIPISAPKTRLFIFNATEPLLSPIRKVVPPLGGVMDLSPIIFYFILEILIVVLSRVLS